MPTLDDVARVACELPEVTEGPERAGKLSRGTRTWQVAGKTFAWERPFSKADIKRFADAEPPAGVIVAIRVGDLAEKEAVLAAGPPAFFTIPHFDGYAAILVQLDLVTVPTLREALVDGWLAVAPTQLVSGYAAALGDR